METQALNAISATVKTGTGKVLVEKRDGRVVDFDPINIISAVKSAFADLDKKIGPQEEQLIRDIANQVEAEIKDRYNGPAKIEDIQNLVEHGLIEDHLYDVARTYTNYRLNKDIERAKATDINEAVKRLVNRDEALVRENANKDSNVYSTQRDLLAGAVVKFPETMKIESLADSLQETIATGEATGQFSELLGRLGVDVEKFNERLGRTRSEASRQNLALQTLRKEGLDELWESYKTGNSDMIEAEKANYNLQLRYVELAKSIEPIETKIKTTFAQVLLDHEDQILAIVDAAGDIIGVGADVIGFLSELNPAVVLVSGGLALIAVKAAGTALGMRIVATGTASATKALAAAGPTAAAAGSQFVMLAADLLMVGAAVFLVTSGIAMLISAIRGVPMINTGTIQVPSMGELQAQIGGAGYARGTRSATPGWRWVGENGPELMRFTGGEAVYTAEQSRALISAQGGGATFVDNSQNIFKVDDIETYVAIKRMLENEKMTVRMGLARR